jgi:hypothetical protein
MPLTFSFCQIAAYRSAHITGGLPFKRVLILLETNANQVDVVIFAAPLSALHAARKYQIGVLLASQLGRFVPTWK